MTKRLYRYRPIQITEDKTVVDELRGQEIYLATLHENNDPMDGLQEVVWDGDSVCWDNLIRHYCFCLLDSLAFVNIMGNEAAFGPEAIRTVLTPSDSPTDAFREMYEDLVCSVFANERLSGLRDILCERRVVHREELTTLLYLHHPHFLRELAKVAEKHLGFAALPMPSGFPKVDPNLDLESLMAQIESQNLRVLGEISHNVNEELYLVHRYNVGEECSTAKDNFVRLVAFFPAYYVEALVGGVWSEYYVAGFSGRADSASMWGHYARGHEGICLVFEFEEGEEGAFLELDDRRRMGLHPVHYSDSPPGLNFFENIGHLSHRDLVENWLQRGGETSELASRYGDGFPSKYWRRYNEKVSHKFEEWAYEHEFRVAQDSWFTGRLAPEARILRYDFKQLVGIIFGVRTPVEVQIEIMKVTDDKLQQSEDREFHFHKAWFSASAKRLEVRQMNLLKFSKES